MNQFCRRLAWLAADKSHGYEIKYPAITLHAICRDTDAYPKPCIFAQLSSASAMDEDEEGGPSAASGLSGSATSAALVAASSSGGPDLARADEIRLQPEEADSAANSTTSSAASEQQPPLLERLFDAIAACQELHPDPGMDVDGEDDDDAGYGGVNMAGYFGSMAGYSVSVGGTSSSGEEGEGAGEEGGQQQAPVFTEVQMAELARLEGLIQEVPAGEEGGTGNESEEASAGTGAGGQFEDAQ